MFTYADNLRLDKKFQTDMSSPLHRSNRFPNEYALERMAGSWPRKIGGLTLWACCTSAIGPICNHLKDPEKEESN